MVYESLFIKILTKYIYINYDCLSRKKRKSFFTRHPVYTRDQLVEYYKNIPITAHIMS